MKKIPKHIEIVRTPLVKFSHMSSKSCAMIQDVLSQHYETVEVSHITDVADLELLVRKQPDLVFLGIKNLPTWGLDSKPLTEIWVSQYLEKSGIEHVGSPAMAVKLDFDKENAKLKVQAAGLPTARFFTSLPGQYKSGSELPFDFPLFIKPISSGGGKGIGDDSVARNFEQYQKKVGSIFEQYGSVSMIEQYLNGREFSVAIMEDGEEDKLHVMPIELITPANYQGDRILGAQVKNQDHELVIEVKDQVIRAEVSELAEAAYKALGGRDYGRIDIRMDSAGKAYFLEANLLPGLGGGYFARACKLNRGMDYENVILNIAELGLLRGVQSEELVGA